MAIKHTIKGLSYTPEEWEEIHADAMRYRWLRDKGHPDNHALPFIGAECQNDWGKWYTDHASGKRADNWIDGAMKSNPVK